jgi:hypothetical protein
MKTVVGISHFFKSNTPKFWQILGDISLLSATIGGAITMFPSVLESQGITDFVMPAFLLTVAKWCMAVGAIIKFITKLIGQKEPNA